MVKKFIEEYGTQNTAEGRFALLYKEIVRESLKNGWGNPFANDHAPEILMANALGHKIGKQKQGADALDENGEDVEYKKTSNQSVQGTYNGVSIHQTWKEQVEGRPATLGVRKRKGIRDKTLHAKFHFIGILLKDRYEYEIIYRLSGEDVHNILLPKFEESYNNKKNRADQRLGAILNEKEIKKYGTIVYTRKQGLLRTN